MTELWRGFANMAATAGPRGRDRQGPRLDGLGRQGQGLPRFHRLALVHERRLRPRRDRRRGRRAAQGAGRLPHVRPVRQPAAAEARRQGRRALGRWTARRSSSPPGGGSDAVDTAAKLARRYWNAIGRPEKQIIISREHGYHGTNAFGTSLQGIPGNRMGYGDLMPHIENIPWGDADALEALLDDHADHIAAFIGEPVIGAGGVIPPPDGFWPRVQELCRTHDVLLISDEVICGFGRLGADFGCQRFGVVPDLMTCAKGLTSGYVPMGAVVVSDRVKQPFFERGLGRAVPPRLHLRRPSGRRRGGSREPRDHRARGPGRARARARAGARRGLPGALRRVTRWSPRCAAIGLAAAVEFTPEALAATPGLDRDRLQPRARARPHRPRAARGRDAGLAVVRRDRGRDRRDGAAPAAGDRRRDAARIPSPPERSGRRCG